MAIPIINPTTSILGFKQYQSWVYQPWGAGLTISADTWSSSTLPPGLTLDPAAGTISGAVTQAGVFNVGLQVTNTNGTSDPLPLTIGIEPATGAPHSGFDLTIDLQTGLVTSPLITDSTQPLFVAKEGEDALLYVRFVRGDTVVDLGTLGGLYFGIKENEPDPIVQLGGGTGSETPPLLLRSGSGTSAVYLCAVKFTSDALSAALSNYEADSGTAFPALAEFKWVETNGTGCGPTTLTRYTQTFKVQAVRNLIP